MPVTAVGAAGREWVGPAVQQSLQADLRNASIFHGSQTPPDDSATIAKMAHDESVDYVVEARAQIAEDQVRVTDLVFDNSGHSIGSAKATGELRQLFDVEDTLAEQIRNSISKSIVATHPITTPIPAVQGSGPIRMGVAKALPIGTVPESYSSAALLDGRDRNIYQVPLYGWFGPCGYGLYGCYGFGGFGCGIGGVFDGGYSTGGGHSLAW